MEAARAQETESAGPPSPLLLFRHPVAGRVLTALWSVLLVLAVVMPVLGLIAQINFDRRVWQPIERVGLFVYEDAGGVRLVPMGGEATGIRHGDRPVAIDGAAIAGARLTDPGIAARLAGPDGTTVRLTTRSADGTLGDHRLTRSWRHADAFYAPSGLSRAGIAVVRLTMGFVPPLLLTLAGVLVFRQRHRQPAAGLLSFAFLIGASGTFGNAAVYDQFGFPWSSQVHITAAWASLTLALLIFPDGRFVNRWARWTAWLIGPFALLDLFAPLSWQVHQLMAVSFIVAAAGFLLWEFRLLPAGVERQQLRWALFGFAVGTSFAAITVLGNIVAFSDVSTPLRRVCMIASTVSLGLPPVFVTAGLLISLFKYRLYDAEAIVSRSVAYASLTAILLALFAATEKVIELLGEEIFGASLGVLASVLGAAVATVMIVPLHHRLTHWAERRFQKQLIRLRQDLPALVGDLREMAPPSRIAAATLDAVIDGVRAARAAVVVEDEVAAARAVASGEVAAWRRTWRPSGRPGLDVDRSDRLFPLRVPLEADGHGRVGWLLLGPRPDGSLYGGYERAALAAIADPVARALEIARLRETREASERDRWRQQERLNAQLAATLAAIEGKLDQALAAKPAQKRKPRARRTGLAAAE